MSITPPKTREHSPSKKASTGLEGLNFAEQAYQSWSKVQKLKLGETCLLDGDSLTVADVVGVAKNGSNVYLSSDPAIEARIQASIETLYKDLDGGNQVYGVTTGFGGSADTRTTDTAALQRALIQLNTSGVLTSNDIGRTQQATPTSTPFAHQDFSTTFDKQSMPSAWARASILIRCNSVIRGHSAVRKSIAENMLALLRHEITPVIPLRGSISASGDLSPLSYIAGALEGSPDIFVRMGKGTDRILTAREALKEVGIEPVVLRAKEGLGLLNGTAVSAATAALALDQTREIAVLSQVLTAMATEALKGTAESHFPRIAEMRPHPGQIEAAKNMLAFLSHSKIAACVEGPKDTKAVGLYQDRYALRTSSQWIGPQLEDLDHAFKQILIELNSTTDNPLIDTEHDHILHGGNFQAAVVTSTMDRSRLAIERIGRMLFAQATEMINPTTSNGLPANLCADDPSLSFTCKGIDINMASYTSELGALANPVGNHVMSAEMHNQAINSLALISARQTFQALDVIRIMCAAYLFTVCQALDLRVQEHIFHEKMESELLALVKTHFATLADANQVELAEQLYARFSSVWSTTTTFDLSERARKTSETLVPIVLSYFTSDPSISSTAATYESIPLFQSSATTGLMNSYNAVRKEINADRLTIVPDHLCTASKAIYTFIRSPTPAGLGLKFHQGLNEHPTQPKAADWTEQEAAERRTIGSRISVIYEALRDGKVHDVVMKIVNETLA